MCTSFAPLWDVRITFLLPEELEARHRRHLRILYQWHGLPDQEDIVSQEMPLGDGSFFPVVSERIKARLERMSGY